MQCPVLLDQINSGSGANSAGSGSSNQSDDNSNPKGIPSAVQSKGSLGNIAYSSVNESSDDEGLPAVWIGHEEGSGENDEGTYYLQSDMPGTNGFLTASVEYGSPSHNDDTSATLMRVAHIAAIALVPSYGVYDCTFNRDCNAGDWFLAAIGVVLPTTGAVKLLAGAVRGFRAQRVTKGLVDTKTIRFTQDSIGAKFKDGRSVQGLIDGLKSGKISPNDLPPIRTFVKDGKTFTLDNRRLFAAHQAGVKVRTVPATAAEIAKELPKKFTTVNEGTIIGIRGHLQ